MLNRDDRTVERQLELGGVSTGRIWGSGILGAGTDVLVASVNTDTARV